MIKSTMGRWLGFLFCVFFCSALYAEQLTVESLVGLKDMGFTEAEIQEQVIRTGELVRMTDADIELLKQAGFSDEMIRFLQNPLPPPAQTQEERTPPARQERPVAGPGHKPQSPPPKKQAVFSEQVLQIQQYLNQLGYNAGTEDGVMGNQTSDAIRRFQAAAGVRVDGMASAELLTQLRDEFTRHYGTRDPDGVSQQLFGGWYGVHQGAYGYQTEMYLNLFPDGSFTSSSTSPMGYTEGTGSYQVQGDTLILQGQYGQVEQYRFSFREQQLIVYMPQVGDNVYFSRY